ncbi:HdeD family acid-resistance protein [Oryzicola mucosus]|uniref:HdeD family acid-resistance protein n=1 Tax=Oryzicola mucosus TaxID=2767425 RepID=A0A8J6U0I6_9HYPH|nr:HdeD family acid-resistance protein [Oryzicola mucosus]MBD0415706.1 HdeD family acid-resistance protein [Oryzicola mucosus]
MVLASQTFDSSELKAKWGWFVALGVLLLIFGFIAAGNLLVATVASVWFVGMLMLAAGIVEIIHAFGVKSWGKFFLWLLSGIFYAIAGLLVFYNPILAAGVLTVFIAVSLVASGLLRIWVAVSGRVGNGSGWVAFGGVITVLAGFIIFSGWPANSLWVLGIFLAVDLIFQGVTFIAFGLGLRKA